MCAALQPCDKLLASLVDVLSSHIIPLSRHTRDAVTFGKSQCFNNHSPWVGITDDTVKLGFVMFTYHEEASIIVSKSLHLHMCSHVSAEGDFSLSPLTSLLALPCPDPPFSLFNLSQVFPAVLALLLSSSRPLHKPGYFKPLEEDEDADVPPAKQRKLNWLSLLFFARPCASAILSPLPPFPLCH